MGAAGREELLEDKDVLGLLRERRGSCDLRYLDPLWDGEGVVQRLKGKA